MRGASVGLPKELIPVQGAAVWLAFPEFGDGGLKPQADFRSARRGP
jgi:hypothetical protein